MIKITPETWCKHAPPVQEPAIPVVSLKVIFLVLAVWLGVGIAVNAAAGAVWDILDREVISKLE